MGKIRHSKDDGIADVVLVKVSANSKDPSIEMTKEQYDSWKGRENKKEEHEDEENH